jgi:hypothetical protein
MSNDETRWEIIGSDRCNEYGQAIYDAITG